MGSRPRSLTAASRPNSLKQVLKRLERCHPRLNPRLVTVGWIPRTSYRENTRLECLDGYLVDADKKALLQVRGANLFYSGYAKDSFPGRLDLWLQAHSLLYFKFKYGLARINLTFWFVSLGGGGGSEGMDKWKIPKLFLAEPMKTILELDAYCRQRQTQFLLILLEPAADNARMIESWCRDQGVPVVSLAEEAYVKNSPYHKYHFPHDAHFNAEGQAYLAEQLAPLIVNLQRGAPSP